MGCMPYGRLQPEPEPEQEYVPVSIPHMGCMPYGRRKAYNLPLDRECFNPSYGLHALRA